jgi:hypothetical protein
MKKCHKIGRLAFVKKYLILTVIARIMMAGKAKTLPAIAFFNRGEIIRNSIVGILLFGL